MPSQEITKKDANEKILKRRDIVEAPFELLFSEATNTEIKNQFEPESIPFSNPPRKGQKNAFVFERSQILELFYGSNIPPTPKNSPESLIVILGAHTKDSAQHNFKIGQPTAIVVGANQKSNSPLDYQVILPRIVGSTNPNPEQIPDDPIVGFEFPPSYVEEAVLENGITNMFIIRIVPA